jgi:hypothetical protein
VRAAAKELLLSTATHACCGENARGAVSKARAVCQGGGGEGAPPLLPPLLLLLLPPIMHCAARAAAEGRAAAAAGLPVSHTPAAAPAMLPGRGMAPSSALADSCQEGVSKLLLLLLLLLLLVLCQLAVAAESIVKPVRGPLMAVVAVRVSVPLWGGRGVSSAGAKPGAKLPCGRA